MKVFSFLHVYSAPVLPLFGILSLVFVFISCVGEQEQPEPMETEDPESSVEVVSPDLNIPGEYRIGGFATGTQAYTFNRFTVFEAIEKTAEAGGRTIELYPGQTLSSDHEVAFTHEVSNEVIESVLDKLDEHGIRVVNFGVVSLPDAETARDVFEFAQKLGVPAITSNPNTPEEIDIIEPLVQEFDIMMAIHNHPRPEDEDSDYNIWDPAYVLELVEDRDPRLGASADTGHWIRSGISPVDGLKTLQGRVISLHLKDVDQHHREGEDVIFGTGVGNTAGILRELKRQNFAGHISIEYESNWYENVPEVAQNIGFIRGWSQGTGL